MRPRDRIMSHLRTVGEVRDPHGLASTALAEAVGYPGSSVAFAQLLSTMERSGLIEREIRGRRTYRIGLAGAAAPRTRAEAPGVPARATEAALDSGPAAPDTDPEPALAAGLDYDELARWLLAEVVRRMMAPPGPGPARAGVLAPPAELAPPADPVQPGDLPQVVASLEAKLASLESRQRRLQAENVRLAELLRVASQSLAEQRMAASQDPAEYPAGLDADAAQLLERLMSSLRSGAARGGGKKTQAG